MKNSSYKSIQSVNVELQSPTPNGNDVNRNDIELNGYIYATNESKESKESKEEPNEIEETSFNTEEAKRSFNAMISLSDIPIEETSTIEHKICAITIFIICILMIIILSYGQLSYWKHSSYIIDKSDNITKIYNTSFTVTCSWHSLHYKQTIPNTLNEDKKFGHLCQENVKHSCSFNTSGKIWFGILFVVMILLFLSSIILIYPNRQIFKLKYIKYVFLFCGLLMFISIIPITLSMNIENDLCGNKNYNEWNKDEYNGYIDNIDEPLWTVYLSPIIGMLLLLSACFIAQIKNKVDFSDPNLFI